MLASAPIVAFLATTDAARARAFFEGVLGLRVVEESGFALVLDAHGTTLRVQRVEALTPHPFTSLGWTPADLDATVRDLAARGVVFERYGSLEQDALGIWTAPGGAARVAWFKDPDGNVLSLSAHGSAPAR